MGEHRMADSGIYEILNLRNGKRYVGSAVDIEQRWREHRWGLNGQRHANRHLQSSWVKHGESAFSFRIIELCEPGLLIEREQAEFERSKPEYNICPVAGSSLGRPHTEEAKAKIGARLRGKPRNPEVVAAIAEKRRGVKRPPEHSLHLIGNTHAKGLKHTEEWKASNSARHTGRKRPKSAEYRAKIAATLRERAKDPAVREQMRKQAADAWASKSQAERDTHMAKVRAARRK